MHQMSNVGRLTTNLTMREQSCKSSGLFDRGISDDKASLSFDALFYFEYNYHVKMDDSDRDNKDRKQ